MNTAPERSARRKNALADRLIGRNSHQVTMETSRPDPFQSRWRSPWVILAAVILVIGAAAILVWWRGEAKAWMDATVLQLRGAGPAAFFAAMALLPAAGFPLMPLTLAAGPVFGPTLGVGWVIVGSILAVMVNVTLTYWLAARALHPWVTRLVARLGYRLPQSSHDTAWQLAAIVRLTPGPPFWLQSYVLGLARVAFVPYLVVSTVVPAGYIAGVILCGDALYRGRAAAAWFGLGLVVLAAVVIHLWRRGEAAGAANTPEVPVRPVDPDDPPV